MFGRDRLMRQLLRERLVVTMKSGSTFEGILLEVDARTVHLVAAFALSEDGRHKADGSVFLPRADVDYVQKPGASG